MQETFKFMDIVDLQTDINKWKKILVKDQEEDLEETRNCEKCGIELDYDCFSDSEWYKGSEQSKCCDCEDAAKAMNVENTENIANEINDDVFKKSECQCKSCEDINNVPDRWSTWEPQTPIENILKNVIDTKL